MADLENTNVTNEPNVNDNTDVNTNGSDSSKMDELLNRIAELETSNKKLKAQNDKMSSAEAERKRKEREQMNADQRAELERMEHEEQQREYISQLEAFQKRTQAKDRYLMQGMDAELADKAAMAELDGDMDSLSAIQKQHSDSILKSAKAEWLRSRPDVNAGTGENNITKEQFNAMDMVEKTKLLRENPKEYERLKSL